MTKEFDGTAADGLINSITGRTPTNSRQQKAGNRKSKTTKKVTELRSKRKQILVTPETDKQLNLLSRIKGVSQNEIINEAVTKYLKRQMQDSEVKELASRLSN